MDFLHAYLQSPVFWLWVGLAILVFAAARPVAKIVATGLDGYAHKVTHEIEQAQRLREEAQTLLEEAKHKHIETVDEAKAILEAARVQAERLRIQAQQRLEREIAQHEDYALRRIRQMESSVVEDLRHGLADAAVEAVKPCAAIWMPPSRTIWSNMR